jgi:prepilin-type N-terminal cleavage/methylation domain-containing protein
MRKRPGFTLWEMTMVLLIMTVVTSLTAPALVRFGQDRPRGSADPLLALLRDSRALAVNRNAMAIVRLDPVSKRFEVDTTGVLGSGVAVQGTLDMDASMTLVTDRSRLQFMFRPSGASFADSVIVRGGATPMWVGVDPWSGEARAEAR